MKTLQMVLAQLIRGGKVTVEIPNLDVDKLAAALREESAQTLRDIAWCVYEEGLSDTDRVKYIRKLLDYGPAYFNDPTAKPTAS